MGMLTQWQMPNQIPEWQLRLLKKARSQKAAKPAQKVEDLRDEDDEEHGAKPEAAADRSISSFDGLIFCITGALSKLRAQIIADIEDAGGTFSERCTKKVDYLICNRPGSKKALTAAKYGTQVVDEDWLQSQLACVQRSQPSDTGDTVEVAPNTELKDGESVTVTGSTGTEYKILNRGGVMSCTCPAWRNQSVPINRRRCKHLTELFGEAFEQARVGGSGPVNAASQGAKKKSSAPGVLLAQKFDPDRHDCSGWWMSEKLDGVRGNAS